jgi:hypothetical protein
MVLDLGSIYLARLTFLQGCSPAQWEEFVNGKIVLKRFRQVFPIQPLHANTWDFMLSLYISNCPQPPSELATLVDALLDDSHSTSHP